MEEKREVQQPDKLRFRLFIIFHVILCASVFWYAYGLVYAPPAAVTVSDIYVDGENFTYIANTAVHGLNGVLSVITGVIYFAVLFAQTASMMIPLLVIALVRSAQVTGFELKASLAAALAGAVLTMAMGVFFLGIGNWWLPGILFLPVLLFEIPYLIGLWAKKRSGQKVQQTL